MLIGKKMVYLPKEPLGFQISHFLCSETYCTRQVYMVASRVLGPSPGFGLSSSTPGVFQGVKGLAHGPDGDVTIPLRAGI